MLYLGDVYDQGTARELADHVGRVYRPFLRRILPTPGNHEWAERTSGYDPFWRKVTGRPTPSWYAVRLAGWTLLSLNSEADHGAGSAQARWLARRLRGRSTCRLAFWHRGRYSAGLHGDQPDVGSLWSPLRGHAALVLNGHDHDLQRWKPRGGLTEIVAGAGGHGLYPLTRRAGLVFGDDRHYGGARLRLRPGRADIALVTSAGPGARPQPRPVSPVTAPVPTRHGTFSRGGYTSMGTRPGSSP